MRKPSNGYDTVIALLKTAEPLSCPEVCAHDDGEVGLDWMGGGNTLSASVRYDGRISWAMLIKGALLRPDTKASGTCYGDADAELVKAIAAMAKVLK